jgi:hypothetical protein
MGMLCCGLEENEDGSMARFKGGLNREIQDILAYNEYNSLSRLFHLAACSLICWQVQGCS